MAQIPNASQVNQALPPDQVFYDAKKVIQKAILAVRLKDTAMLRAASNQTIHNASVFQDEVSINVAVITYAISKLVESRMEKSKSIDLREYDALLHSILETLTRKNVQETNEFMAKIFKKIKSDESKFPEYVRHVRTKASLKKSMKLVDHGISMGQAASKLGISQWQLYSYVGKTKMNEEFGNDSVSNMKKRLVFAMQLFEDQELKNRK